jgi:hypothetical protein
VFLIGFGDFGAEIEDAHRFKIREGDNEGDGQDADARVHRHIGKTINVIDAFIGGDQMARG